MREKRKIGLLTLNDNNNYGNRLQNYATQEVLRGLDFEVETIKVNCKSNDMKDTFDRVIRMSPRILLLNFRSKINNVKYRKVLLERKRNIKKFTDFYIKESKYKIDVDEIPSNLSDEYDYFVVGSDQVWNPRNIYGNSTYFLTFADRSKRIAFAPSFGLSEIPTYLQENYRNWLNGIDYISVREVVGSKIIKNLTGKEAEVLVDPTILLDKEKWLSISKPPDNFPQKKYAVKYFLGKQDKEEISYIDKIIKKENLEVIELGVPEDRRSYLMDPSEFLWVLNNADIIFTNSFHGAVFSIIFERPFIVFERNGMNSRVQTLLSKFNLESRMISKIDNKELFYYDTSKLQKILNFERNKSLDFLKKAMKLRDE